jgi:hypothetical protein
LERDDLLERIPRNEDARRHEVGLERPDEAERWRGEVGTRRESAVDESFDRVALWYEELSRVLVREDRGEAERGEDRALDPLRPKSTNWRVCFPKDRMRHPVH